MKYTDYFRGLFDPWNGGILNFGKECYALAIEDVVREIRKDKTGSTAPSFWFADFIEKKFGGKG